MDMTGDKLLVIAKDSSKSTVLEAASHIPGIDILEADSENKAFELIYNHAFVLMIIDETRDQIDSYKIGSMLLSHKETQNIPLLIITDEITSNEFLTDFKALQVDYVTTPVDGKLLQAKIKIFYNLFKQKNAVLQSIDELDTAYKKIVAQNEHIMHQKNQRREIAQKSSIAAIQMQQSLPHLKGSIQQLIQQKDIQPETRSILAALKTASENISNISNELYGLKEKELGIHLLEKGAEKPYRLLYAQGSSEEYHIFYHCLKNMPSFQLVWAKTMEDALALITQMEFDLIFTDYSLPGATGFDLLSRLKQLRSDTPVIFAFAKSQVHMQSQALSKGALNFFVKEEISAAHLLAIIENTLQKSNVSREVEDAMNRIVMIAQKDTLTQLYTPEYFEKKLSAEIDKANRYKTALSILIVHFDNFEGMDKTVGPGSTNIFLATSAALIQSMIRESDMACCYTKDQFALLLTNTGLDGAKILAQRITKKIKTYPFKKDSKPYNTVIHVGAAFYDARQDANKTALIKKAMDALNDTRTKK